MKCKFIVINRKKSMEPFFSVLLPTLLFVLIVIYSFSAQFALAASIHVLTGELPPYSYSDGEKQVGIGSTIVKEICSRTGVECHIESLPWSRSVGLSQKKSDKVIYPLGRTAEREDKYLWVGPILDERLVFLVRKSDEREFSVIDDFKNLKVGVSLNTPPQKRLQKLKFAKIDTVVKESMNIKKLLKSRLDAWYAAELIMMHTIEMEGYNKDNFRIGLVDRNLIFYIGLSKNMEEMAIRWQTVLNEMKSDGTYQRIVDGR